MADAIARIRLGGKEFKRLFDAVIDAFNEGELRRCVKFDLDLSLDNIVRSPSTFPEKIQDLIEYHERADRVGDLIEALRSNNSGNVALRDAADAIKKPAKAGVSDLEKILREHGAAFRNPQVFREQMASAEARVCRIETGPKDPIGTGFLIGPDLVLTCYHVVDGRPLSLLKFRFDARVITEESVEGQVTLAGANETPTGVVSDKQLDFAVVRLAEAAGKQKVGQYQGAPERGWQTLTPVEVKETDGVAILQHPNGSQLSFAGGGVVAIQGNRLQYAVNTEPGSSGSPVFDTNWQVVAVHCGAGAGKYNEGTRITPIIGKIG